MADMLGAKGLALGIHSVADKANFTDQLRPTVFIGLGGTGLKVLARFRRRIYDRYGDADKWKVYRFLAIDTNKEDIQTRGVSNQKGYPLANKDIINIGIKGDKVEAILGNLDGEFRHYKRWLTDAIQDYKDDFFRLDFF